MGTAARCRDFRCSGRGGALSPPAARGRRRFCRGRPMCRPGHVPSRHPSAGGHIGPPLRGAGRYSGTNGNWRKNGPCQRGGTEPAPCRGIGADLWRLGAPGERRGEVTPPYGCTAGGAQQRADVVIGPYGDGGRHAGSSCPTGAESGRFWGNCETFPKHRRSKSAKKTEFVQKTGEFRWTFPARWCTIRRSMR